MSRSRLIGCVAVAMLGGCGAGAPIEETGSALIKRCPDPLTDCTVSNGTGVYTDEEGFAGIGGWELMLTRFINKGTSVGYQGRYFDASSGMWFPTATSSGMSAEYLGKNLWVRSVSESFTIPTFTLFDYNTSVATTVTGPDLVNLTLHIGLNDPDTGKLHQYEMRFDTPLTDTSGKRPVRTFHATWRELGIANNKWTEYCTDIDGLPDPVVFQQGFIANPVTADVIRNANTTDVVTFSCNKGAMATVGRWGYPHHNSSGTWYFDAGLHMKRASYCGDSHYFTKKGQKIHIADDVSFNSDPIPEIEAYWTPAHATCYGKQRYPQLPFDGHCGTFDIPKCSDLPTLPPTVHWLADGPL